MLRAGHYTEKVRAFLHDNQGFSAKSAIRDGTDVPTGISGK
jgi:hypothetical protein